MILGYAATPGTTTRVAALTRFMMSKRPRDLEDEAGPCSPAPSSFNMNGSEKLLKAPQVRPSLSMPHLSILTRSRNVSIAREPTRTSSSTMYSTSVSPIHHLLCVSLMRCGSPPRPEDMNWSTHYPAFFPPSSSSDIPKQVEWADVGCGFGGLLMALAPHFPDTLMLVTSLSLPSSPPIRF